MSGLSASEQYLQNFHDRVAGATTSAFANLPAVTSAREYASSYDVLASIVYESTSPKTVLDVACGDGHLLGLLAHSALPLRLMGLDMSKGELDLARATLPGDVSLFRARAQDMPFDTGSVDIVVSHMALMLMDDIEGVLANIRRVLAPGGTLAAVVGRTFLLGDANEVLRNVFKPIAREDLSPLAFGDARTRTVDGWAALLNADFNDLQFEDVNVPWKPTPHALWNALVETYDIDRLSQDARERLRDRLIPALSDLSDAQGLVDTGWGLRLIRARAP